MAALRCRRGYVEPPIYKQTHQRTSANKKHEQDRIGLFDATADFTDLEVTVEVPIKNNSDTTKFKLFFHITTTNSTDAHEYVSFCLADIEPIENNG